MGVRVANRVIAGVLALSLLMLMPVGEAEARYPGGMGIGVGTATKASGLSLKFPAGPSAFQVTAGCRSSSCSGVAAAFDFLASMPPLVTGEPVQLAWNLGGGVAVGVGDDHLGLAGAFVMGLEVAFQPVPLELVFEWRPNLRVIPDISGPSFSSFGGHFRIYF